MYEKSIADPKKFEMIKSRERTQDAINEAEEKALQEKIEHARTMLRDNMPTDLIACYLGLPLREVQALQ